MTPLACEQCGYDVTSSEVREGTRFCPECGQHVRGESPGVPFFRMLAENVVRPSLWILGAGFAWAVTVFGEASLPQYDISVGLLGYPVSLGLTIAAFTFCVIHVLIKPGEWARMRRLPRNRKMWALMASTAAILGVVAFIAVMLVATAVSYAISEHIRP